MNQSDHITENRILEFHEGKLPVADSDAVAKHLLACGDCRRLLPQPTREQLWDAILIDTISDGSIAVKAPSLPFLQSFCSVVRAFNSRNTLAWGAGALVVLFGFAVLLESNILNFGPLTTEVARSFEPESTESRLPNDGSAVPLEEADEKPLRESPSRDVNRDHSTGKFPASSGKPKKPAPGHSAKESARLRRVTNVSETRGVASECGEGVPLGMEFASGVGSLFLNWDKYPGAAKYHLYISDEDEVLIEEFETEKETSYSITKNLDPRKKYKWKVVITLSGGKTVNVSGRKFGLGDFRSTLNGLRERRSTTRCSMNQ